MNPPPDHPFLNGRQDGKVKRMIHVSVVSHGVVDATDEYPKGLM